VKYLYRKAFDHEFEAQETAKGFLMMPGIDKLGAPEVWTSHENGNHYVYVALEGEFDPEEVLAATGYARVN
jgi:hypothetical protein